MWYNGVITRAVIVGDGVLCWFSVKLFHLQELFECCFRIAIYNV
jgi:hypothetical protein